MQVNIYVGNPPVPVPTNCAHYNVGFIMNMNNVITVVITSKMRKLLTFLNVNLKPYFLNKLFEFNFLAF